MPRTPSRWPMPCGMPPRRAGFPTWRAGFRRSSMPRLPRPRRIFNNRVTDLKARLSKARLYLVTDQELSENHDTVKTVEEALKGGVDIVQLREYFLTDTELLTMARAVRELTLAHKALFI